MIGLKVVRYNSPLQNADLLRPQPTLETTELGEQIPIFRIKALQSRVSPLQGLVLFVSSVEAVRL